MKLTDWIPVSEEKPPLNKLILVTDGNDITITELSINACPLPGNISMSASGWGGPEWEFEFDYKDITYWQLVPEFPK